jgi:hypothetical protein
LARPGWVIASVGALGTYLLILATELISWASQGGYELEPLNRTVSLIAAVFLGVPTLLLGVLMFVRRLARPMAVVAVGWMAFTAFLWLPVSIGVGGCALLVALVVLASLVFDWRQASGRLDS